MRKLFIGGCAWGDHYVDMLINYCLPSMMASIEAAQAFRKVILGLHTDYPHKIQDSPIMRRLRDLGIEDHYFPVESDVKTEEKYMMLGKYQGLGLKLARELRADYHSLMPDHVYSNRHFDGLMAAVGRGHKAITRLCVSTVFETIAHDLASYRKDGVISISHADLTSIAFKNLHSRAELWGVKEEVYPNIHIAMFEGKYGVSIFSPHQSILYIDRDEIRESQTHRPLDNELDFVIAPDCPIYSPKEYDRMGLIEVTRANTVSSDKFPCTVESWCAKHWAVVDRRGSKYFDMETIDPINREILDRPYLQTEEIARWRNILKKVLKDTM